MSRWSTLQQKSAQRIGTWLALFMALGAAYLLVGPPGLLAGGANNGIPPAGSGGPGVAVAGPDGLELAQARTEDLSITLALSGSIVAGRSADVLADVTGRIERVAVEEGASVRRGELLVRLDSAPFAAALAHAQAGLEVAKGGLNEAMAEERFALQALWRAETLRANPAAKGGLTDEEFERIVRESEVSSARRLSAQGVLAQATAQLRDAEAALARTRITSPISGTVVRLQAREGEVAVPGTFSRDLALLATVADLSTLTVHVEVPAPDVAPLRLGDEASVDISALPGASFPATITRIREAAVAKDQGPPTVTVELTLNEPPQGARVGLPAIVHLKTSEREGAITVPLTALVQDANGRDAVLVWSAGAGGDRGASGSGSARLTPVRVGILTSDKAEIVDGITAGTTVVAGPVASLQSMRDAAVRAGN